MPAARNSVATITSPLTMSTRQKSSSVLRSLSATSSSGVAAIPRNTGAKTRTTGGSNGRIRTNSIVVPVGTG
jgi:hypothetical protein